MVIKEEINISGTLEYRINGGCENNRGGGLEMVQYNSNRGGLGEIENSRFLRKTRLLYIFM